MTFRGEDLEQFIEFCIVEKNHCIACGGKKLNLWASSGSYNSVQCNKCGLIMMNPFLNNEGLGKYYSDHIGRRRLNNETKIE